MITAGTILVTIGGVMWLFVFMVFVLENERLPGTYLRWSVYQNGVSGRFGDKPGVVIGIRRRNARVPTGFVAANSSSFDDDLIAAIDAAREKAITLNVQTRSIARSLS